MPTVQSVCQNCGKVFFVHPYRVTRGKAKHCSMRCKGETHSNKIDAFWSFVAICSCRQPCPYHCFEWQKGADHTFGYGAFHVQGRKYLAHRFAYTQWNACVLTKKQFVCHYCHNPLCCNPLHLHVGGSRENIADSMRDGRMRLGSQHPSSKLTEQQVTQIFQMVRDGVRKCDIARHYAVTRSLIGHITHGRAWKHVHIP